MKQFDYAKYDPESRAQLQFIHIKEAIEELEKKEERNYEVYEAQGGLEKMILDLEYRVKVLEEARQRQIQLNTDVREKYEAGKEIKKSKSFWDIFK